ncbi:cyclin-dependent kinase inhibitor 3 family protein [Roseovarius ramblicola]|uniref:Cyclin-dependent kinase inhibitor 3 family protein n=1 Tax=Roseovarius ramblicola TaxID=2022336 RepID=A0ABV5I1E7_9RHOB
MADVRTSESDPLRIAEISVTSGCLGLTLCPGKRTASLYGGRWERDLDQDVAAIRKWGATRVVTLVERDELAALGVPQLGAAMRAAGLGWHHVPIRDASVPGTAAMTDWRALSPVLHAGLERGERLLLHCRGGLGRAGTMAALLMVERGADPAAAMSAVRAARPGAIETREQETWLGQQAC